MIKNTLQLNFLSFLIRVHIYIILVCHYTRNIWLINQRQILISLLRKQKKRHVSQHYDWHIQFISLATFSKCLIKSCAVQILFQCLQGLQGNFIAVWDTHFTDICQVLGTFYSRYLKNAWNFSKDLLLFVGVTQWS